MRALCTRAREAWRARREITQHEIKNAEVFQSRNRERNNLFSVSSSFFRFSKREKLHSLLVGLTVMLHIFITNFHLSRPKRSLKRSCKLHVYVLRTLHDFCALSLNKCNQWHTSGSSNWMSRILVARLVVLGMATKNRQRRILSCSELSQCCEKFMSAWVKKCNNHYYRLPFPYYIHLRFPSILGGSSSFSRRVALLLQQKRFQTQQKKNNTKEDRGRERRAGKNVNDIKTSLLLGVLNWW